MQLSQMASPATKKMVGLWNLLVLLGLSDIVSCDWSLPSSRGVSSENVRRCYADMTLDSDISHLLIEVTSREKIDHFCGRISRLKKCIADNEHYLSISENTNYLQKTLAISTFYINVCPPGTDLTQRYKDNAPCFQLIKNKILTCGSDLPDTSSYKMQNDLNTRCCALKKYKDCMTKAAYRDCGSETARVMEDILTRYFRPQLQDCKVHHLQGCTKKYHSLENEDHELERRFHVDQDHHFTENDDWAKTTAAEQWKKPKSKHNSGTSTVVSIVNVIGCLVVLLVQLVL